MVVCQVGMIRLELFGLDDDTSPLKLVSTCLSCGAQLTYTRFDRWPDGGEEAIRRIARADGKVCEHHRC